MSVATRAGLAALVFCSIHPAFAVVNIENLSAQPTRLGWSGNTEAAVELKSGNSEREAVKIGARADWFDGEDTAFVVFGYDYGQSNDIKDADSTFIHGRYIDAYSANTAFEYFAQVEQNEFRRLSSRAIAGGGIRFALSQPEQRMQQTLAAGLFHSDEQIEALDPYPAESESGIFGNFYWVVKYEINDRSALVNTLYWQPALHGRDGFRALDLFSFRVQIDGRLSLKVNLTIDHDSLPPGGIEKTDSSLLTGLSYEF
ncbi:DUF481 domain-containing protein [Permianibacter sp. IMCC34836]|uniref:DUF481 domain-containing protein n=1 Tax=Permianibacter fluminis TaxID=2738515 RepID=UPI001553C9EE|nr:DUF481 domain-containing protein [Permianibacter fluminis]NQD38853.1 DUF481 domain-containing protein [Permianibacter fluminis]